VEGATSASRSRTRPARSMRACRRAAPTRACAPAVRPAPSPRGLPACPNLASSRRSSGDFTGSGCPT
jgi:hypothetical protein